MAKTYSIAGITISDELHHSDGYYGIIPVSRNSLLHAGVKGMHWYSNRWYDQDGNLTAAGKRRLGIGNGENTVTSAENKALARQAVNSSNTGGRNFNSARVRATENNAGRVRGQQMAAEQSRAAQGRAAAQKRAQVGAAQYAGQNWANQLVNQQGQIAGQLDKITKNRYDASGKRLSEYMTPGRNYNLPKSEDYHHDAGNPNYVNLVDKMNYWVPRSTAPSTVDPKRFGEKVQSTTEITNRLLENYGGTPDPRSKAGQAIAKQNQLAATNNLGYQQGQQIAAEEQRLAEGRAAEEARLANEAQLAASNNLGYQQAQQIAAEQQRAAEGRAAAQKRAELAASNNAGYQQGQQIAAEEQRAAQSNQQAQPNFFQQAGDWIGQRANDVKNWATPGINNIGNTVNGVGDWIGQRANDVKNWATPGINNIGNAVNNAGQWIGDRANDVSNWWRNDITGEGQWDRYNQMNNALSNGNVPQNYTNMVEGMRSQEYDRLRNGGDTSLFGRIGQFGRDVGSAVTGAVNNAGQWIGDRASDVGNWWRNDITGEGQWDTYNDLASGKYGAPEWAANAEYDRLRNGGDTSFFGRIGQFGRGVGSAVTGAVNNAGQWIGDRASDVGNWWRNDITGEGQWDYYNDLANNAEHYFDNSSSLPTANPEKNVAYQHLLKTKQDEYDRLRNGGDTSFFGRIGQFGRGVGSAVNDAGQWIGDRASDVGNWVSNMPQNVDRWWRNDVTGAGPRARQLADDVSGTTQREEQTANNRAQNMPDINNQRAMNAWASNNGMFYNPATRAYSRTPTYMYDPTRSEQYYEIVDANGNRQRYTRQRYTS